MVVSEGNVFYAYIHYKPDFTPFYVGKGRLKRANSLKRRNPYYMATVEKYGAENIIIGKFECSREENAFDLERGIIKCLKKAGVKITNFTDGGEGSSGRVYSLETREKMRIGKLGEKNNMFGKPRSLETRAKISAARKGKTKSLETKEKMRIARTGEKNHMFGKTHSLETKAKISEAGKGKSKSAAHRAKISASLKLRRINGST